MPQRWKPVYKKENKCLVKETVCCGDQSVVIIAGDGGGNHDKCGKGIVQKFQSKDMESERVSE